MHRYAIDCFLNLFTAEITGLFVANRQGNTLKLYVLGLQIMADLSRPMLNKIEDIAQVSEMHACNACYKLEA